MTRLVPRLQYWSGRTRLTLYWQTGVLLEWQDWTGATFYRSTFAGNGSTFAVNGSVFPSAVMRSKVIFKMGKLSRQTAEKP